MASRKKQADPLEIVVAAQNERLNAHEKAFIELKADIKEILKTTVETNLKIASLPTWENLEKRSQHLAGETRSVAQRVDSLEAAAAESKGSWKVVAAVAGVIGTGVAAVGNWFLSKL